MSYIQSQADRIHSYIQYHKIIFPYHMCKSHRHASYTIIHILLKARDLSCLSVSQRQSQRILFTAFGSSNGLRRQCRWADHGNAEDGQNHDTDDLGTTWATNTKTSIDRLISSYIWNGGTRKNKCKTWVNHKTNHGKPICKPSTDMLTRAEAFSISACCMRR